MKFGLRYANTRRYTNAADAVEIAQAAEAAGFESIWTIEHTVVPDGYQSAYPYAASGKMADGVNDLPLPDPLIWLAYIAAATSRIKLATGVIILPQHNVVAMAKQVATLDHLSGGRVLVGVGVGWLAEEFAALGVPFDDRAARTDDYIGAMRALWSTADATTYHGSHASFDRIFCRPQPVSGRVPIIIGGHSKAAARRAGRIGDGFFPARGLPTELFDEMRSAAEAAGRDPDEVEITVSVPDHPDDIAAYAKAGVSRVLVPLTDMAGLKIMVDNSDDVARYGKDVIARFA